MAGIWGAFVMKIATVGLDLAKIVRLRGDQTDEGQAAMAMGSAVLLFAAIFDLRDRPLEKLAGGAVRRRVTQEGDSLLRTLARID
jgi:hypothetical protein